MMAGRQRDDARAMMTTRRRCRLYCSDTDMMVVSKKKGSPFHTWSAGLMKCTNKLFGPPQTAEQWSPQNKSAWRHLWGGGTPPQLPPGAPKQLLWGCRGDPSTQKLPPVAAGSS